MVLDQGMVIRMLKYDITFHPGWWHQNAGIDFTQEFFDHPEYRMECDVKIRKMFYERFGKYVIGDKNPQKRPILGTDLLAAGYLLSELMGCKILYEADNSPQVICMECDVDSLADIKATNLEDCEIWGRTQKQIDYLMEHYGRVETYVNLMGIQNIAMDIMGQELLLSYYLAPKEVDVLLAEITKLILEVGRRLKALSGDISGGVSAIVRQTMPEVYLTSNCSVEMISNELYERFLLKYDQQLANTFKTFGVHHCGKTMEHVVDGYSKIKGLVFAEVGAFSDIKRVREKLPGVFLNARYSPVRLMNASEAEIQEEVASLVRDGQENGQNLSLSCVGIDKNVSDEKICSFLDACRQA